jgi:hypothetical protein
MNRLFRFTFTALLLVPLASLHASRKLPEVPMIGNDRRDRMKRQTLLPYTMLMIALLFLFVAGPGFCCSPADLGLQPYPRSTFITDCSIDPTVLSYPEKIERPGDNWPVTWAADGKLYSFWADGVGFAPQPKMFSMHPCVLWGDPTDGSLTARDIPADATGKGLGGDASGRKVSGLIAVPDPANAAAELLVAWVRNITKGGGASLMYSRDHGATWTWAWGDPASGSSAVIRELGHPSWVQAGKGNSAAPDEYLYFISHDAPSAYRLSDGILLGRVRWDAVLVRACYEYFSGTESRPSWSTDIRDHKTVFTAAGQCYRPFAIYHPAIKRYLLLTSNGGGLLNGHKGTHDLGIYEAETLPGPWRTVYFNDSFQPQWGVFAPQIVPAWISDDGRSCWLLYSCWPKGPYKFNLQRIRFEVPLKSGVNP